MSNSERSPAKHRRPYSVAEIFADGVVHTAALIAGAAGFALLFALAPVQGGAPEYAALIVYAVCFFLMFGFSFAYNMVPDSAVKRWLRRCDHSGIYLMIAGTYTALMALAQANGGRSALVVFVWCGAIVGVASKLFMPTRFDRGAVGFYLALGWSAIVAIKPLAATLPATALALIVAGGLIYSAGVPFYIWRSLKFQNAIWHACVALGARLPVRRGRGGDRRAILTPQSRGVLMTAMNRLASRPCPGRLRPRRGARRRGRPARARTQTLAALARRRSHDPGPQLVGLLRRRRDRRGRLQGRQGAGRRRRVRRLRPPLRQQCHSRACASPPATARGPSPAALTGASASARPTSSSATRWAGSRPMSSPARRWRGRATAPTSATSSQSVNGLFSGPGAVQAVGTAGVGFDYAVTNNLTVGLEARVNNGGPFGPFGPLH